jgi:sulfopyruvate decarboxylase subunit alpha
MPVSATNSKLIYDALKECDIRLVSALPETWLVHLIRAADEDPEMILVRLAKEEEGGRSALCRGQVGHADAEPRLPGIY